MFLLWLIFLLHLQTKEAMTISMNIFIFFVLLTQLTDAVSLSTSSSPLNFADHCDPQYSTPHRYTRINSSVHSLTGFYYTNGEPNILISRNSTYSIEFQNSIVFRFQYDKAADDQGFFRVQGSLRFPRESIFVLLGNSTSNLQPWDFRLNGVWSESSGELCMVGSASLYSKQGNFLEPAAVLKLHKLNNSSNITSLIRGPFESLISSKSDPSYFGPIYIALLPSINYKYTFLSNETHNSYVKGSVVPPSSLKIERFCRVFSSSVLSRQFPMRYSSRCVAEKSCSPLGGFYSPRTVSLKSFECLEDEKRLRVLVNFADNSYRQQPMPFDHKSTLIGEGSWDAKTNQLIVAACRFLNVTDSLNEVQVGDCSTRLSLRFPAVWTMGNSSSIVGQIWSTKTAMESGYFENIIFGNGQSDAVRFGNGDSDTDMFVLQGQKYDYTQGEKVTKLCPRKKSAANKKNNIYPNPLSFDMRFDISVRNSTDDVGWGYSVPLSVDNKLFDMVVYSLDDATEEHSGAPVTAPVRDRYKSYDKKSHYNISYRMSFRIYQLHSVYKMVISAEGIYDDTEGSMCMVGCRNLDSNSHQRPTYDSIDCEIVVNFQFPPTDPKNRSSFVKGSIKSTRKKSDPLYFDRLELTSVNEYIAEAKRSITRMDVEIIMVVISNTLACVFGVLQLFHVKRHPNVLPSISILMLVILALGYMIPLVLNFDAIIAMFTQHGSQIVFLGNGWLELDKVIVNVVRMVGFLLQLRLLQLAMSARSANGDQKELWDVEKLALFVALPVYVAGSLVALLLMNWSNIIAVVVSRKQGHPIFGITLKSSAGLMLDAFLFPQILLNMFSKSTEKALSVSFYVGTTIVQGLPHAYHLYRDHTYAYHLTNTYIYASSAAQFYSTTWNVIIPSGGVLFAGIIFLQQHFGGAAFFLVS